MTPGRLLALAEDLLERPGEASEGLWSRSAALLLRQALEGAMAEVLNARAPGARSATFATQLVILRGVLGDEDLGRRVGWTWEALSGACHADGMKLPAGVEELRGWGRVVKELVG